MSPLMRIRAQTTIRVLDHKSLLASFRALDAQSLTLVGSFHVDKPLTPAQLRRLPSDLRRLVQQ